MRPKRDELERGDVLDGKYRVDRILGRGGMGVVAAAWDLALERTVAIKTLRAEGADEESLVRFAREARALSQLRSEHVVKVFDVGNLPGGAPYIVMEHLVGEDVDAILAKRALDVEEAVLYALQACEGLAEAHANGILHRDVKPPNLFVTTRPDGRPLLKLVDFGVAKHVGRASLVDVTAPAIAVGSALYMSPEQARALPDLTPASEVFSLGTCLYEMLTRQQPFAGDTMFDVLANVIKETPPSPHLLRPDVPPALAAVAMRCLEKAPGARYPDVAHLAEALEPFGGALGTGTAARAHAVLARLPAVPPSQRRIETRAAETERVPRPTAPETLVAAPERPPTARRAAVIAGVVIVAAIGVVVVRSRSTTARAPTTSSPSAAPPAETSMLPTRPAELPAEAPVVAPPVPSATARDASPSAPRATGAASPSAARPSTTTPASAPPPAAPVAPVAAARYDAASAHVELGSARNTFGVSPGSVGRGLAPLVPKLTGCYRAALSTTAGAVEGAGTLHLETDEDGVVVSARLVGPVTGPAPCLGAVVRGKRIPNVDTGRASADVPVTFIAR